MKHKYTKNKQLRQKFFKIMALTLFCCGYQSVNAQDSCIEAVPIVAGTHTVGIINGDSPSTPCSNSTNAQNGEWFVYVPDQNYSVTITSDLMENICKDTSFNVYTGGCSGLFCYTGDDDSGVINCNNGNNTNSYLSKKTFDVYAGAKYYIVWDNRWNNSEGLIFQLSEAAPIQTPCLTAIPITAGITTVDAINGQNISTSCSTGATLAKWYKYQPMQNYRVTVSSDLAENICKDTRFSVYTGSCSSPTLTCVTSDDNSGIIECNSGNTLSNLSKTTFDVVAGMIYYIVWDNRWSAEGFVFELTEQTIVIPIQYNSQSISSINSQYNICVVDMNGDGKDDIAGVSPNNLRIHYQGNAGALTYQDFPISGTSRMPGWSLAAGDYNRDGFTDLVLGNTSGLTFWKSANGGTSYVNNTPSHYIFCQRTNFVDINNDGNLDAFSCHDVNPNVYYLNDTQGTGDFTYYQSGITAGAYNLGVTPGGGNYASLWSDLDNDGDLDLFISKCSGPPCEIHRNDGNGVFTDISAQAKVNMTPIASWSSAIADFDNDGDMDILIGTNGPSVKSKLLRNDLDVANNITLSFTDISAGSGWDTNTSIHRDYIAYDFDNDGWIDILAGGNKIMFNRGNMVFEATTYPGLNVGGVGDLNNDGFLDILNGNTIHYAIPNSNNWMKITLKGMESNIHGIGARVEITGSFGKKIRDVRSGEGFEFMSSLNVHFGLGTATAVEMIKIIWPSGIVDTIMNPDINKIIHVVESSTLGIEERTNSAFALYPNPTTDYIEFAFKSQNEHIISAEIFDLSGRKIARPEIKNNRINVQSLPTGAYIVLLENDNGKLFSKRFLKK